MYYNTPYKDKISGDDYEQIFKSFSIGFRFSSVGKRKLCCLGSNHPQ